MSTFIKRRGSLTAPLLLSLVALLATGTSRGVEINTDEQTRNYQRFPHEGHPVEEKVAELDTGRVLYSLVWRGCLDPSHDVSEDARIGVFERRWDPLMLNKPVDRQGFPPFGLLIPSDSGWEGKGFLNVKADGVDHTYLVPEIIVDDDGDFEKRVAFRWETSRAEIIETFCAVANSDRLLLEVEVLPKGDLEEFEIKLNSAFKGKVTNIGTIRTARGIVTKTGLAPFDPASQNAVVLSHPKEDRASCALLFLPEEIDEFYALKWEKYTELHLRAAKGVKKVHLALWETEEVPAGLFSDYIIDNAARFTDELRRRVEGGWRKAEGEASLPIKIDLERYTLSKEEEEAGLILFGVEPFDYATYESTPPEGDRSRVFRAAGCPGQYVPLTFSLYALEERGELRFVPSPLRNGGREIGAGEVDVSIVKVWYQISSSMLVRKGFNKRKAAPELLVKDDSIPLKGFISREGRLPSGLTGPFEPRTRISSGTSKQFWVTVHIPEEAKPGKYDGTIAVGSGDRTLLRVPIEVTVLPFSLPAEAPVRTGLYYRESPWPPSSRPDSETITEETFRTHLKDIREHGFNTITYYGSGEEELDPYEKFLAAYREFGFREPVILVGWGRYPYERSFDEETKKRQMAAVRRFLERSEEKNLPRPVFYLMDEPSNDWQAELTKKRALITREAGGETFVAFYKKVAGDILIDTIDYPNIEISLPPDVKKNLRDRSLEAGHTPLYNCQVWGENPRLNRLVCGYYLWNSGYKGFVLYNYRHLNGDPYFDVDGKNKDLVLTYPSREGPVPTMQWEACREGIYDYLYVHLLQRTLEKAGKAARRKKERRFVEEKEEALRALMTKYDLDNTVGWGSMMYWDLIFREREKGVPNRQFREDRLEIAEMIMELKDKFRSRLDF